MIGKQGTHEVALPPSPDEDVLGSWRWYFQVVMWPAAPKTFQKFWGLVESCAPLQNLCQPVMYDTKWLHALIHHLGTMWFNEQGFRRMIRATRTGRRGRPRNVRSAEPVLTSSSGLDGDFELCLCVLNIIVMGLIQKPGEQSKHWRVSADLLKHFLPGKFPSTWDRQNLRARVNKYLRNHRPLAYEGFMRVGERATHLTSDDYRQVITGHLSR